jgi:F0F1-type ATP synthase assembly protein I
MLKKLISAVVVGALAKVVLDRLTGSDNDADLWAEATDAVPPGT